MKKSKLLSIFLTMTLVVTTIFAGTESIFAGSVTGNAGTVTTIEAQDANAVKSETDLQQYTATMTTGKTDNVTIIPIHVSKKGTLQVPLAGIAVGKSVTVSLHSDPSASDGSKVGYSEYLSSSVLQDDLQVKLPKAGTYYLKFETVTYSAGEMQSVRFAAVLYPAGGTPAKGKVYYGSSPDNNGVSYYKVTAPGNGYLTVSFPERLQDYSSFNIKLLNYKKNSLFTGFEYISSNKNYKTRIGVKKGTYYIAVKNSDKAYGIKISFTSVKENSGKTKGKAKSIYKGGTKKGIITAAQSENSGDWYKFKVTKTQYVKFNVSTLTSQGGGYGGIKFAFYQAGRNYPSFSQTYTYSSPSGSIQPYTPGYGTKLTPGTYYIKVQKYGDGNGYYKLKWR